MKQTRSVLQKSDTSRTIYYIVREVSLFWPTLYVLTHSFERQHQVLRTNYYWIAYSCDANLFSR